MKKCYWLLMVLLFSSAAFANQTITISTSEWPPFVSQKAKHNGYISQVIKEAFAQVNIKVNFEFVPWARAYEKTKVGHFDATSYWYDDARHKEYFHLSEPLSTEKTVFFRLKSERPATWKSLSDFNEQTMGLTRGFTYTEALWQYAQQHKDRVSIVVKDQQNFEMLLLERIDITPVQEIVGWHYMHSLFAKEQINRVETMQPPLLTKTGHLLFPKANEKSKVLLEKFNKGLAELKKSGRLFELKEKLIQGYYSK